MPDWDNQQALTIFEQMLQKADNKIDGVLAANDGLGNAAISALKQRKLDQIPVTGQDATLQGIQNIVNGDQCMTVYKAIKKEADAAAKLAIALAKGEEPTAETTRSTTARSDVPSVCSKPVAVTKDNIKRVPRGAGLPEEGGDLRRGARRQVRGARPLGEMGTRLRRRVPTPRLRGGADLSDVPILELRGVSKSFGAVQALYQVDFHVAPGEVMALVGDNGAGKSTLIKCIAGHLPVRRGRGRLRRRARQHPRPEGRRAARDRGRLPGPRAGRQPRRRAEHVPRPRGGRRPAPARRDRRWRPRRRRR